MAAPHESARWATALNGSGAADSAAVTRHAARRFLLGMAAADEPARWATLGPRQPTGPMAASQHAAQQPIRRTTNSMAAAVVSAACHAAACVSNAICRLAQSALCQKQYPDPVRIHGSADSIAGGSVSEPANHSAAEPAPCPARSTSRRPRTTANRPASRPTASNARSFRCADSGHSSTTPTG
jgi:hypothetical protein